MWKNDFWGTSLRSRGTHGSYRPLCVLSFRLNHWACGFRPWGYHAVNVLLHCLATGLVYKTGRVVAPSRSSVAGVAALLFAVHPVHTEAVAGIVGRADVLSSIFFLLSFLTYTLHVRSRERLSESSPRKCRRRPIIPKSTRHPESPQLMNWVYLFSSLALAACAMLCKETGITVLAVNALYDILLHRHTGIFKLVRTIALYKTISFTIFHQYNNFIYNNPT
jgi:4-amino-4-deoxy-L-arabinose transferase-like glycosyltransferase